MGKVEIEERALLDAQQRSAVLQRMERFGNVTETVRVVIDFTPDQDTESEELRVQNHAITHVRKHKGARGRTVEDSVPVRRSLLEALHLMAQGGNTYAKVALRRTHEVKHNNLIYSLRDVLYFDDPRKEDRLALFELEINIFDGHDERSRTRLRQAMRRMSLPRLKDAEFRQWVQQTHDHVDGSFEYSEGNALALVMKLQATGFL